MRFRLEGRARRIALWALWPAFGLVMAWFAVVVSDRELPLWRIVAVVVALSVLGPLTEQLARWLGHEFRDRHPWVYAAVGTVSVLVSLTVVAGGLGMLDGTYLAMYAIVWFFAEGRRARQAKHPPRVDGDTTLWGPTLDRDDGRRWRTGAP